jgi:hypothetical protein
LAKVASIAVLGLALLRPSFVSADTLTMTSLGKGEGITIQIGTTKEYGWAGEINWLDGAQSIFTYCVDLFDNATNPQYNVTVGTTDDLNSTTDPYTTSGAGGRAASLFNTYADMIHSSTSLASNAMAAGLQIAIWQTMYDPGAFTVLYTSSQQDVKAYAAQFLANVGYSTAVYLDATGAGQDQITKSVPEPPSILLSGLGILCLGLVARRRTMRTQMSV